jgi:hypothetical protein
MTQEEVSKLVSKDRMKQFVRSLDSVGRLSDIRMEDPDTIAMTGVKESENVALWMAAGGVAFVNDGEALVQFLYLIGCLGYSLGRIDGQMKVLRMMSDQADLGEEAV